MDFCVGCGVRNAFTGSFRKLFFAFMMAVTLDCNYLLRLSHCSLLKAHSVTHGTCFAWSPYLGLQRLDFLTQHSSLMGFFSALLFANMNGSLRTAS